MASPRYEPATWQETTGRRSARKVLSLRELLRRERWYHALLRAFGILGIAIVIVTMLIAVAYWMDTFNWEDDSDAVLAISFYALVIIGAFVLPLWRHPFRYQPAKTHRLLHEQLSPHGNPETVVDAIDLELQDRSFVRDSGLQPCRFYRQTIGHIIFTEQWLLWFGWMEFCFLHVADVVWFYKRIEVKTRFLGMSDRVLTYLVCVGPDGTPHLLRLLNEEYVDEAMDRLLRRRPEALCGFQGEWRALAETEPEALRELAAQQRAEWERLSSDDRADARDERLDDAFLNIRRVDASSSGEERKY
jgi:hypothetical protein